jgi:hypothetical protein
MIEAMMVFVHSSFLEGVAFEEAELQVLSVLVLLFRGMNGRNRLFFF